MVMCHGCPPSCFPNAYDSHDNAMLMITNKSNEFFLSLVYVSKPYMRDSHVTQVIVIIKLEKDAYIV